MIQDTLLFSTKFNVVPTTAKFVLTDLTPYAVEGIALTDVKGVFKIEGPSGIIYNNTNFGAPDITANVSLIFDTVSLPLDTDGKILKGTYTITYTVRIAGGVQPGDYTSIDTSYYCYVAPSGDVEVTNSVRLAKVTSKDLTSYPIDGVMPTLTRTHTLYYPATLALSPTVSSNAEIQLSYPNVYTGTYSGKISTVASYVFSDGLIVDYLITAVDETIVDNKTLCDIYCGIKNLTNEMLTARSTGDFGKADKIQETLSLVSILFQLYDDAITCGKEDDATNWLNQIIAIANITVGCGCTGDEPTLVIPEGGGGSGDDVVVNGDSSFGTEVSSNTVGTTTTYTVRLTQAYKELIQSALQSQDLSVSAFRAAGIPEEARGILVTPLTSGGGTISLTPGTSKKILILTGTATLTGSWTVSTVGTPIDGDSFTVDYRATLVPNSKNVTIFGISLSDAEIATGNCLVYTWYAASTATWYSKLINNISGGAGQEGLNFWVNGPNYVLNDSVLYGSNPSYIYVNILAAGSGANAPSGTTASNTYWRFVGNKSALYDGADNIVFDVTNGKPFIIPTLTDSISTFSLLVLEGQEMKKRALSLLPLAGASLTFNKILIGNVSNIAEEQTLNSSYLRSKNISGVTGGTFTEIVVPTSGTVNIDSFTATPTVKLSGTTTLIGNVEIKPSTGAGIIQGDYFWFDYIANVTIGGNALSIAGVNLTASEALAGNLAVYAYYDTNTSTWKGRKITYGVTIPIGDTNQTVRYNGSILEATSSVLVYSDQSVRFASKAAIGGSVMLGSKSLVVGEGNSGTGTENVIIGNGNTGNGQYSLIIGQGNVNTSQYSFINGASQQNLGGGLSIMNGASSFNYGVYAILNGAAIINNASYITLNGTDHTTSPSAVYSIINGDGAFAENTCSIINANSQNTGLRQKEQIIDGVDTSSATPANYASFKLNSDISKTVVYLATYTITAIQTGGAAGTAGDCKTFKIIQMIKLTGGVASLVGSATTLHTATHGALTTATVVPYVTAAVVGVTATGETNKNIRWTIAIDLVNAGY